MDPTRNLHFDDWTLVRPAGELVRGSTRVRLQSQPLLLLEALLAQPGEMLSREQLIARLWPNGIVVDFDTALNSAVRRLRTALDDHAECPRYIETIPRRGYRFIGHLHPDSRGAAARWGPTATRPAMTSPAPAVHDAPAAESRAASGRIRPVLWAGAVAAVTGAALSWWLGPSAIASDSGRDCRDRGFPAGARRRARALRAGALPASIAGNRATRRSRSRCSSRRCKSNRSSRGPGPASRACAGSTPWKDASGVRRGLELTRAAAEAALQIDPDNVEALLRLANYYTRPATDARANALARRAQAIDPDDPLVLAFRAGDAAGSGRFDEAVALQRRAVQGGPLSVTMRYNLAVWLFLAGRFEEARVETGGIARHQQARRCAGRPYRPVDVAGRRLPGRPRPRARDAARSVTGADVAPGLPRAGSQGGIRRGTAETCGECAGRLGVQGRRSPCISR